MLLLPCTAAAATLTRAPYLQLLTTHSVTIAWNTDVVTACSLAIRPVGGSATVIAGEISDRCAIPIDGLVPGAAYAYRPLGDGLPLDSESIFQTDDPAQPFDFLVVGSTGSATTAQLAVRDRMLATPTDFILSTGDMVFNAGAAADFDPKFFTPYGALLRRVLFWPCLGSRDVSTAAGQPWRDAFDTPANNAAGSENYYSFDFGNAHVTVLDTNASTSPGSPQSVFLDQDLGASAALWNFVVFHHTMYTNSPTASVRKNLVPVLDRHNVDLVFMGRSRVYERTKPLRANKAAPAGIIYITSAGGGASLGSAKKTSTTAYTESSFHFVHVMVDGLTLHLQMIRQDGAVRDSLTLVKVSTTTTTTSSSTTTSTSSTTSTTSTTSSTTTTQPPLATLSFLAAADTYVDAGSASKNFGSSKMMTVQASPVRVAYLRFVVTGVAARSVTQASVRLTVDSASGADSASGGRMRTITNGAWLEGAMTYKTRATLDGSPLPPLGPVKRKQLASFDVSTAVAGDGTFNFALDSTSSDDVRYFTREATAGRPELVLTLGPPRPSTTTTTTSSTSTTTLPGAGPPDGPTVFIIMMENHDWSSIKGSAAAPYINQTLLPAFAHAENYRTGGIYPSLPSYITLEAGDNFGLLGLSPLPSAFRIDTTDHLTSYLNAAGISWRSYSESLPGGGSVCAFTDATFYSADHNAFAYFNDVTGNPPALDNAYCRQHIRPYEELAADLQNDSAARYNFIIPNDADQGEKAVVVGSNKVAQSDTWLKNEVPKILASRAYQNDGVLFIVWDEGVTHGVDNPIGCILVSRLAKPGYANTVPYSHASTLRSVQKILGVRPYLRQAATATDLSDLFTTFPSVTTTTSTTSSTSTSSTSTTSTSTTESTTSTTESSTTSTEATSSTSSTSTTEPSTSTTESTTSTTETSTTSTESTSSTSSTSTTESSTSTTESTTSTTESSTSTTESTTTLESTSTTEPVP